MTYAIIITCIAIVPFATILAGIVYTMVWFYRLNRRRWFFQIDYKKLPLRHRIMNYLKGRPHCPACNSTWKYTDEDGCCLSCGADYEIQSYWMQLYEKIIQLRRKYKR